jgi:hypothetical protein
MHHLLADTSAARIAVARAYWKLFILELTPDAQYLDPLSFVSVS